MINPEQLAQAEAELDRYYAQRYAICTAEMRRLMKAGEVSSPEFRAAWKEAEECKNRNGGMPPINQK